MATANLPSLPHRAPPTRPLAWPLEAETDRIPGRSPGRVATPTRKLPEDKAVPGKRAARRPDSESASTTGRVRSRSRSRSRSPGIPSPLKHPLPWVAAVLVGNIVLYAGTVAHETHLSRWRSALGVQKQNNVQLRATLSAARSLAWIDTRARGLGLTNPTMIAYLPPLPPPPRPRPAGPIGMGAAEGF